MKEGILKNLNERLEMYNLFLQVADRIRSKKRIIADEETGER